ncbi:Thiosulfate sulfurtransferase/rhodanese-like domain-containing protein 3 [Coemansia erecta]|uniref:Thiosulfate sulfurtransferase/rhodanese-like domain-containing protein 3 n=1 Tax=Coemansia erecta TaxID=147472 RepID=A0A9W7XTQ3_9FUNG|nr:Thiosulfate sulfurtransferase/rhodanese-like domain-containing protein 3 [Coemansia erecta]
MSSNVKPIDFAAIKSISEGNNYDNREIFIVDVRNPSEFSGGSIPRAVNIPLPDLDAALELPPAQFKTKYGFDLPDPASTDKGLVVHCQMGGRAAKAANALVDKKKYENNLYIYSPGWREFSSKI